MRNIIIKQLLYDLNEDIYIRFDEKFWGADAGNFMYWIHLGGLISDVFRLVFVFRRKDILIRNKLIYFYMD